MSVLSRFLLGCLVALAAWLAPVAAASTKPDPRLRKYQEALRANTTDAALTDLLAGIRSPEAPAELDALAGALASQAEGALPTLRALLQRPSGSAPAATAELLWRIALKRRLTADAAALAADLLGHDDPFVRGLAEWAIATKVGQDNDGQQIAWPRPDPPEWFQRWAALGPEALLDADYTRQAIVWNIHHDGAALLGSVAATLRRARGAAAEAEKAPPAAETRAMLARQLAALDAIHDRLASSVRTTPADIVGQRKLWLEARRAARPIVLANPAADFGQVLFITRHAAHSHRNITGSQYPWVHKPGGDICIRAGLHPGAKVRGILEGKLGPGHVHGMDLWWDADRVVFAYARQPNWPPKWDTLSGDNVFVLRADQEPTHLYEIRLDGSGPRQLTNDPRWNDFEPTWLANGDVAFASDRSGRSSECGKFSADHTVINIYAISPDGKHLRRLSDNKDIDRYPHSLDNGLLAYTRWDYQERHFFEVHAIWTVRPDGTMPDAVFNQHMKAPFGLRDTRSVPGSPKLVSIATGHHTFAYGPVVVIDPRKGINTAGAIQIVTPRVVPEEGPMAGAPVPEGGVPDQGGLYQTPWALSERCFLVSYSYARTPSTANGGSNPNGFALYLIDACGNKELIHRDPLLSCSFPVPLRKRPRPPVVTDTADREKDYATCYVTDVYDGAPGLPRGSVKHLRILQRVGWPLDASIGAMRWIPGNAWERQFGFWSWAPVRVIGTVAVEADGSAHFRVPVDAAVYFETLDDKYMELRRMRSHVTFQPAEARGCRGCHETQAAAPAAGSRVPVALLRDAETPTPPPWGAQRLLGYEWLVQPIFDRHCLRCHGRDDPKGGIDLSATRTEGGFYQSFRTLFPASKGKAAKPLVSCSDRFSDAGISQPKEFGSHRSPLVLVLLNDPLHKKEVRLAADEWLALVTWVDANAPYYDTFCNRRPPGGGGPRRDIAIELPSPFGGR